MPETVSSASAGVIDTPVAHIDQTAPPAGSDAAPVGENGSIAYTLAMLIGAVVVSLVIIRRRMDRLPHVPNRIIPFGISLGLITFASMHIGMVFGQIVMYGFLPIEIPDGVDPLTHIERLSDDEKLQLNALIQIGSRVGMGIGLLVPWCLSDRIRIPTLREPKMSMVVAMLLGIGATLLVWPLVSITGLAGRAFAAWMSPETDAPAIAHETLSMMINARTGAWWYIMIFMVGVAAPVTEEIAYRGIIQNMLRQGGMNPWPAIGITSIVFALIHLPVVEWYALLPLFILSLGFGWAYEKSGRLLTPIIMHVLFNLANVTLAVSGAVQ